MNARVVKVIDQSVDGAVVRQWVGVEIIGGDGWMVLFPRELEFAEANPGDVVTVVSEWL